MNDYNITHFTYFNSNSHHDIVPKDVVTVTVHPSVTAIKDHTFDGCSSLTTINIPDLVTTIGGHAFSRCTSLSGINIPDLLTTIGNHAFYECTLLTTINIPDRVTTIENRAFFGCTSLATINIPKLAKTIGNHAFSGCTSITAISIPNHVTTIGSRAFSRCTSLTTINISDLVTTIGNEAFSECTSLTKINIPDLVTTIRFGTFSQCTSLTTIKIPDLVTTIGGHAFSRCTSLISINIPDCVTTIGNSAFYGCSSLTLTVIPQSVRSIGFPGHRHDAFRECKALKQRQANGNNYHANSNTWLRQRFDNLPLHQACYNNNKNTLTTSNLHNLIQQHGSSMLTSTDAMLMTPLHVLCCNPTATIKMIQMLKAAQPLAASTRNVMNETPLMILLRTKSEKYSAFHDEDGQLLPLVGLLEHGLDFDALKMITCASSNVLFVSELQRKDKISGLLPFMYSASLGICGLDVVYELAMTLPDLLPRMH
jgi:hypothetical protein